MLRRFFLCHCFCCCCCVVATASAVAARVAAVVAVLLLVAVAARAAGGSCVFLSGCFSFRVDFSFFLLIFSVIQAIAEQFVKCPLRGALRARELVIPMTDDDDCSNSFGPILLISHVFATSAPIGRGVDCASGSMRAENHARCVHCGQTSRWRASRRRSSICVEVRLKRRTTEARQTLSVLRRQSSLDMSRSTLWRGLHEDLQARCFKSVRAPRLTAENRSIWRPTDPKTMKKKTN